MNSLYLLVKEHFPEFVRADYPVFVEFVQTYYKWLADQTPGKLGDVVDLHKAPEDFVRYFRNQLDVYGITSQIDPYDFKYLTNIKEIYTAKGSEQGLVELLRIVTNVGVTIDYPSENILRASDGRWLQESFITVRLLSGEMIEAADRFSVQFGDTAKESFLTRFEPISSTDVRIYYRPTTILPIAEGRVVVVKFEGEIVGFGTIIKSAASLKVVNGGADWQLGQVIVVPGSSRNSVARVSKIDALGTIQRVEIVEYGYIHNDGDSVTVYPSLNDPQEGTQATLQFEVADIVTLLGKWKGEDGQVSNEAIRLQDSFFYQQFSYVINSETPTSKYVGAAGAGHVAGTKPFYNLNLTTSIGVEITGVTSFPFIELQLGPDTVSAVELIGPFEFTTFKTSEVTTIDVLQLDLNKYLQPISVSLTQTENTNSSVGFYAAEDYFAEDYNASEITLNIGV